MAYCKLRNSPGDLYSFGHQFCLDEEIDTHYGVCFIYRQLEVFEYLVLSVKLSSAF